MHIPFCYRVMEHNAYLKGNFGTNFIDLYLNDLKKENKSDNKQASLAAITIAYAKEKSKQNSSEIYTNSKSTNHSSKWKLRRVNLNKGNFK